MVVPTGKLAGQGSSGKNFSTIPSKFETTLFTGNKERDGFGTRAHRFVDMEVCSWRAILEAHACACVGGRAEDPRLCSSYLDDVSLVRAE